MIAAFTFVKARWKTVIVLLLLAGAFLSGNVWSERGWQKKVNMQTAARPIEQGGIITHDEAVKDAQAQAAESAATVSMLRTEATKHPTHQNAADLAAAVRSKTTGAGLDDILGSIAGEARYYAKRSDESYRAGLTCELIFTSVTW
ncbi:DUF2514 domain-containing protein [Salmonella enterica]|nr:DUF2514 domain-containing protein [Salmonella enterica]EFQ6619436.1 DUF2514 domain-containing protein [Salmonella enterica]